jgi:fructose-bisphosphate aldolase class II/6-phospho-5-dehydro-2-deoxy-D-gluconate aldolase
MNNGIEIIKKAYKEKYAIPQFNINNLEWTKYILEESNLNLSPVILGVSESAIKYMGGYNIVYKLVDAMIKELNIKIPVILHLDHGSSFENCKKAIDSGFSSVMIDFSLKGIEENINETKRVKEYAEKYNVSVESEIGYIASRINKKDISYASLTDCKKLYNEAKTDVLAPAVGNIHGLYKGKAKLNFDLIKEISDSLNVPLALHGGTGISNEDLKQSIKNGISKVNINTELQYVWSKAIRKYLRKNINVYDPRKIISSGETEIKRVIKEKIVLCGSNNKA